MEVRATGSILKQCDFNGLTGISGVNECCVCLKKEVNKDFFPELYSLSRAR